MAQPPYGKTYIREWRKKRGYSLRRLAALMESEPGVELMSHANIGRIETGDQPYTQPILEALSHALNVSIPMLLEMNPEKEGEVVDLVRLLSEDDRRQAVRILEVLAKKAG